MNPRSARYAMLSLVLLWSIWGYNWVIMKSVLRYADPFQFATLRCLLGAASLFVLLAVLRRPLRPTAIKPTVLLGLLQTSAFMGLAQWALVSGGAGKTAVLTYTMPFWLLLLAWPLLGERLRGVQWLAVVLASVGLIGILQPWQLRGSLFSNTLAIAAGLTWAASAIVAKRLTGRRQVDLLNLTAWQMLFGALALALVTGWIPARPIDWNGYFIAALAFNALPATALAWLLWLYVLSVLPAGTAGLNALVVPTVGVIAAWIQLGEVPTGPELTGMLLIIAALGLLAVTSLIHSQPTPHNRCR